MSNNAVIPVPVVVNGGASYGGNSFLKPFPKGMLPDSLGIASQMEGAIDPIFGADIVRASGSPTTDYTPSTLYNTQDRVGLMYWPLPSAMNNDFYPPTT